MKISDSYAAPARRSEAAKVLSDRRYGRRVVKAQKGKGSYTRERVIQLKMMLEGVR